MFGADQPVTAAAARCVGWPGLGGVAQPGTHQTCGTSIGMRTPADIAGGWSNWLRSSGEATDQNRYPEGRNLVPRAATAPAALKLTSIGRHVAGRCFPDLQSQPRSYWS